jgi:hypothetical protein
MSLSFYNSTVTLFTRQLANLSDVLAKGEAYAKAKNIDPLVLTSARLAPDMFPLSRQIQIATDSIKGAGARLAGVEVPSFADTETTFPELQERIAKTAAFLKTLKPEQFEGAATRTITFKTGKTEHNFTGEDYLLKFVLPNSFFHLTTAYAILRHNGVDLGKSDYLGNLAA